MQLVIKQRNYENFMKKMYLVKAMQKIIQFLKNVQYKLQVYFIV